MPKIRKAKLFEMIKAVKPKAFVKSKFNLFQKT